MDDDIAAANALLMNSTFAAVALERKLVYYF